MGMAAEVETAGVAVMQAKVATPAISPSPGLTREPLCRSVSVR